MHSSNADWLRGLRLIDFLRDTGKHFTLGYMMQKESVRSRLETGISYTEFSYMVIQAYDFWHLFRTEDCELQIGGSDQWGNITAGIELIGKREGRQTYGLVFPLVTSTSGTKFGKSEAGNVWLDPAKTSPYQFYQYWINVDDADVGKCLKFFTDLGQKELEALLAEHAQDPGKRAAQRRLATDLTRLVHGDEGLQTAQRATEIFFGAEIRELNDAQLSQIFADVPSQQLPRERLAGEGLPVVDAFVEAGLAKSKGEARRLIGQGGVYVNNRRVESFPILECIHIREASLPVSGLQ
jgi:tyrosyl-tRNA synthetase